VRKRTRLRRAAPTSRPSKNLVAQSPACLAAIRPADQGLTLHAHERAVEALAREREQTTKEALMLAAAHPVLAEENRASTSSTITLRAVLASLLRLILSSRRHDPQADGLQIGHRARR